MNLINAVRVLMVRHVFINVSCKTSIQSRTAISKEVAIHVDAGIGQIPDRGGHFHSLPPL